MIAENLAVRGTRESRPDLLICGCLVLLCEVYEVPELNSETFYRTYMWQAVMSDGLDHEECIKNGLSVRVGELTKSSRYTRGTLCSVSSGSYAALVSDPGLVNAT
jgi:hypothetical protein